MTYPAPPVALFVSLLALAACAAPAFEPPPCGGPGIALAPTATRPADPDLFSPPVPPPPADGASYCPTPEAAPTRAPEPGRWMAGDVVNLALDRPGQTLAAAAMGDDMLAVAWLADGEIWVALSRGGHHFQVRRVDRGGSVSLAFSKINRLHVVYEQESQILYRAADQGMHPADVSPLRVEDPLFPISNGHNPQVVVDEMNWAHVLYEQDGGIFKAKHLSNETWLTQFVAYGTQMTARPFYNEREVVLFGVPTGSAWFGILLTALHEGQLRVLRYLSWFNLWEQVASFPLPADESLIGAAGLDFRAVSVGEAWATAAWITRRAAPQPPPRYAQPIFEPVNPLYPYAIANPTQIATGLNAARWRSDGAPFAAGLRQTVTVDQPGELLIFSARGLAVAGTAAAAGLRVGIDPTGGTDPDGATVVWSAEAAPDAFATLAVSAPATGPWATVFLAGTSLGAATAVWDEAAFIGGALDNGSFEAAFSGPPGLETPTGWTPFFRDEGDDVGGGRDSDTIHTAWSVDGGATWTAPLTVAVNRGPDGTLSGAFSDVFPVLDGASVPPALSFMTVFAAGDPPPASERLRFGRPHIIRCGPAGNGCDPAPGAPLLPSGAARPASQLLLVGDPLDGERALLVWDALQSDAAGHDVYATFLALRREETP